MHKQKKTFHVVVPSLPGFGFSEAPKIPGHGVARNAELIHELMIKLGYTEYGKLVGKGKIYRFYTTQL